MTGKLFRNLLLACAIATPVVLLAPAERAEATSLAPLTIEQMTDASDYVVHGTITEVWTEVDDEGLVWSRARLTVHETLKGKDDPQELVIDSLGGTHEGYTMRIEARAQYSVHEEIYTFLTVGKDDRLMPVGKFLGKFIVRRAPGDKASYVRTFHGRSDNAIPYDARFLPHYDAEDRLYVNDFRTRVESRLQAGWDGKKIPGIAVERLEKLNTLDIRKQR